MEFSVAERLAQLRRSHGYSQGELARKLGLSRQAVSKWERAEAAPDTENLIALARLYGVTLDELAGLEAECAATGERSSRAFGSDAPEGDAPPVCFDNEASEVEFAEAASAEGEAAADAEEVPIAIAPRVWRRAFYRAAVCILSVALLAMGLAGWFVLMGPHPRVTDALGITSTHVDEINFAGIDRIVVNWPAGEVKIESMPTLDPLRIEEHGIGVAKQGCFRKEGSTLEVWAGDARAWDDRDAIAHDLTISVPLTNPPSAESAEDAPRLAELVLNTGYGSFRVEGIEAEALDATMRNGSVELARSSFVEYRFS